MVLQVKFAGVESILVVSLLEVSRQSCRFDHVGATQHCATSSTRCSGTSCKTGRSKPNWLRNKVSSHNIGLIGMERRDEARDPNRSLQRLKILNT